MLLMVGFVYVREHVFDDATNMIVRGSVENLPPPAFRAKDPCCTEESKVVADKWLGERQACCNV